MQISVGYRIGPGFKLVYVSSGLYFQILDIFRFWFIFSDRCMYSEPNVAQNRLNSLNPIHTVPPVHIHGKTNSEIK